MIGLLGGSFDPIHYGHLHIAQSLLQQLNLQQVRFIPCKDPLLKKKTVANVTQRLAMLSRALQPYPSFCIDTRELDRASPSYTLETLSGLRRELGQQIPLILILGNDQFAQLNHWYEWTSLVDYAHLVVVPRLETPQTYPQALEDFILRFKTDRVKNLSQQASGLLLFAKIKPLAISISSTLIRAQLKAGVSPVGLLPASVLDYISEHHLYL
ncbi:nicotinate-nucleotide adenylyltransferase [Rickettsiella massiliensis]|uniref:nicotinate-nucleotide adenylyltransferase n=1 Tax=Rickettsiella massiliensis TaxID=676517 RepID=UPI00029ACEE5|nr:nicotinate-nucleotide adenylyltransferase [Rickettsiella massiliensis]